MAKLKKCSQVDFSGMLSPIQKFYLAFIERNLAPFLQEKLKFQKRKLFLYDAKYINFYFEPFEHRHTLWGRGGGVSFLKNQLSLPTENFENTLLEEIKLNF